jgi:hypothetical protein
MQGDRDSNARYFDILLYNVAAFTSEYEIKDLGDFTRRILSIMGSRAGSSYSSGGGGIMDAKVEKGDDVAVAVMKEEEDMVTEEEDGDNDDATIMAATSDGILNVKVEKMTTTNE